MFFNTLILAISSSIDAIGIGITYGLRNLKFPILSQIVFFFVALISTSFSIFLGRIMKNFLSPIFTNFVGSSLIIGIGIYTIIESYKKQKDFDLDKSNDINIKESIALSLSVTADSLCIGLGGSLIGINYYLFPVLVATFHISFLLLGIFFGKRIVNFSKIPSNFWSVTSGVILILIGFTRFLMY